MEWHWCAWPSLSSLLLSATRLLRSPPRATPRAPPRPQPNLGIAAEHGFYLWPPGASAWTVQDPELGFGWKDIVQPILQARRGSLGQGMQQCCTHTPAWRLPYAALPP